MQGCDHKFSDRSKLASGPAPRRSLRKTLEQLSILVDDLVKTATKRRILLTTLDGLSQSELHRLVEALAFGTCERLGVSGELVVEADSEVLRHDTMVSRSHGQQEARAASSITGISTVLRSAERERLILDLELELARVIRPVTLLLRVVPVAEERVALLPG